MEADAKGERINKDTRSGAIAAVDVTDFIGPLVSSETRTEKKAEATVRQEYCSWTKVPAKDRTRLWCGDIGLSAAQSPSSEPVELPHPHEPEVNLESLYHGLEFSDDMKGGKLNRVKVIEARRIEIAYFKRMGVYTKVPRGGARAAGCKVITIK